MVRYLTPAEVLRLHSLLIKRYGGKEGIRDFGLIDSALARPKASFAGHEVYADILMKSAVLLHSLIKNHGFVDGNKRTATTACVVFLQLNGYQLTASPNDLVDFVVAVAEDTLNEDTIAKWLKNHTTSTK